ncbi:diphosphomevalonate decarboxylase [Bacillus sp. B1-b2]|uniref:diphosphomevalonate decarboxylase n=1 Tax=Bacillus sp. B1-b2 TaxID=2653201 RepID=UPI0012617395|nr:diphosphomevalonate decarboxylase [Bacillus sp. B1-b2]KAB7667729.1 diphosphomevalonate decarboxylase [Bacillus sp. B1-b2]
MEAIARAHTNIALIKYWGKRDSKLFLPMNSSLSITLDHFYTETKVQFSDQFEKDTLILDGEKVSDSEAAKITAFLQHVRNLSGKEVFAEVTSVNHVPTAAGFASSASGYAALAAAASKALQLDLTERELSMLARQGSGSASRSVYGGFVEWQKGNNPDGTDSYAKHILDENAWDLSVLSVVVEAGPKSISSREGMERTVKTSPFYEGWLATLEEDLKQIKEAIAARDFTKLGTIAEANAMKMHATSLGAKPPVLYWQSATLDVMQKVTELRQQGLEAYFTIDAGPNVKVLCERNQEESIKDKLAAIPSVRDVIVCHPGPGIQYLTEWNGK